MINIAKDGYDAPKRDNPYLYSSPNWHAYAAGQKLAKDGHGIPIACRMSRGCSVRIKDNNDQEFIFKIEELEK